MYAITFDLNTETLEKLYLSLRIDETEDGSPHYLRVVTLEDGETIHNAFFDRDFRQDAA